ncbi:MAG TPA: VWA domain-containing protein [Terriglobia bacterium]|nr:VWA domain-containing protein [Terriglobia bacterium]
MIRTLAIIGILLAMTPALAISQPPQQAQPPVLKVQTEVVNVYAVVTDKHGYVIPNLTRDDFQITDNGAPQQIRYFSIATDTPLTMGILVDTSPSQRNILQVEQQQATNFLREVMRAKDLAFVLHFDLQVELLQDFTPNVQSLIQAINETEINGGGQRPLPGTFPSAQEGYTHLYDAVWLASTDPSLMPSQVGRKVLILLTDGMDEGSKEMLASAIEAAQKADVIIYAINIADPRMYSTYNMYGGGYNGESILKKMAQETGGEYLRVGRSKDTAAAFAEIERQLRTQYLLGYKPTDRVRDGSYHRIRVRVNNKDYRVQARQGYYATAVSSSGP